MAIKYNPTYSVAYNNRGNCLYDPNRLDEALASYDMAIEHNPTDSIMFYNRGNCLYDLNRLDEV